jgi:phage-related protein
MELFKLLGTIAIDNTEANNALEGTTQKAHESANETESAFAKIGGVAKNIAIGIGTAGLAIGGAFIGAVESTREYRAEMGLLDAAFQTAGHSSTAAKDTYSELNAVLGDSGQAVEASQHLAKIADNEKELTGLTDILTGVYATFGESLPLEGLAEGINHSASLGEVQGSLADALEWSGITVEDFNEKLAKLKTEEERQDLIVKTLKGTYSEASTQYKETNKDIMESRKAQERLTDAMAKVGEIGEPIMTALRNAIASLAEKAVPVLEDMVNWFRDAVTWIKQNETTVQAWIAVILGATTAIAAFVLIISWGKIMTAAANAVKVVRTAIIGFNAVLMANPIALVVAALAGLVVAFIYLWNNVEGFREFWKSAWATIKSLAQSAWTAIRKFFSDAWSAVKKTWSAAAGFFRGIWDGIKSIFNSAKSWFSQIFRSAWNGVKSIWNGAKKFFSGIWSGIKGAFGSVGSWFGSTFRKAWSNIKSAFNSWGSFFSGLWSKIKSKFGSIGSSIGSAMGNAVRSGMNGVISKVQSTINKGIGFINSAIRLANKLPGINVGTVPTLSLPRLAKGGVLEKGQVGILEGSGTEAVVPLENNRKWISRVAEDMNEMQKTKQPAGDIDILPRLNRIIELLENMFGMQIRLDSGVLVGELTPAVDARLGRMYRTASRGR